MSLKEQLEKVQKELQKLEEQKKTSKDKDKDALIREKELKLKIELEETKNEVKKNRKVMEIVEEHFGEVTEENFKLFQRIMEEQSEQIRRKKEQLTL